MTPAANLVIATGRRPSAADPDDLLRTAAVRTLRSSGYRPLGNLRCEVRDGVVTLFGVVPSFYLKQMAQALLLRLGDVRQLTNRVEVG